MRLVAFTFSISLPGVPESWESRSLGSLRSPGVLGVSGVPESQTVNCTFAGCLSYARYIELKSLPCTRIQNDTHENLAALTHFRFCLRFHFSDLDNLCCRAVFCNSLRNKVSLASFDKTCAPPSPFNYHAVQKRSLILEFNISRYGDRSSIHSNV